MLGSTADIYLRSLLQDFLMEPGWIRDAAWSGRVASAREELQDKLTSYRELKTEAKAALAADPNNEERKVGACNS